MNFLLKYNISEETIDKMKENNEESTIFFFMTKQSNVEEIIKYLQSIHITAIEELLINRIELFLLPLEKIKERFETYNIDVLARLTNEDINVLNNV